MSVYLGRLRRYGAWALVVLGLALAVPYSAALHRGWTRARYLEGLRSGSNWRPNRFEREFHQADRRAFVGDREGAERILDPIRWGTGVDDHERQHAFMLGTRLLVQFDGAPVSDLHVYLAPSLPVELWGETLYQMNTVMAARGDFEGRIELWESVIEGRLRHPDLDRSPFPYPENVAARTLADIHLERGDGRKAHAWALRLKHEFDCDSDAPCGMAFTAESEHMEVLLERSALLAGIEYTRESQKDLVFGSGRMRRIYGPPWPECALGIVVGLELIFAGLSLLRRRSGLRFQGPLWWRRRGAVARIHLGLYLAALTAGMLALVPEILRNVAGPGGETLLLLSILSVAYCTLLIPFLGCFIAAPASLSPTGGVEYRDYP